MVTPGKMVAPAPIQALRLITIGRGNQRCSVGRVQRVVFGGKIHSWPNLNLIFDSDASNIQERAGMVDKNVFTQPDEPAKVGMEWRKNRGRRVDSDSDNIAQLGTYLIDVGSRCVHLDAQPDGTRYNFTKLAILRVILTKLLTSLQALENIGLV